ncbi:MAG: hypothetical protein WAW59_06285 [Patescibacteria group bacterium]
MQLSTPILEVAPVSFSEPISVPDSVPESVAEPTSVPLSEPVPEPVVSAPIISQAGPRIN